MGSIGVRLIIPFCFFLAFVTATVTADPVAVSVEDPFVGVWYESYSEKDYEPIQSQYLAIWKLTDHYVTILMSPSNPGRVNLAIRFGKELRTTIYNERLGVSYTLMPNSPDILLVKSVNASQEEVEVLRFARYSENEAAILQRLYDSLFSRNLSR